MTAVLEKIAKFLVYATVFIIPLFFFPYASNVLDFPKQALFSGLVFLAFFLWIWKSLLEGKFFFNRQLFNLWPALILVAVALSTAFSSYTYESFWGSPLSIAKGFVSLLVLVIFYYLIVNLFKKQEEYVGLLWALIGSSFFVLFIAFFQSFSQYYPQATLPFSFAKTPFFNTIGTLSSLGVMAVSLLVLIFPLFFNGSERRKFFTILMVAVSFLSFFVLLWAITTQPLITGTSFLAGLAILLVFGVLAKDFLKEKLMAWIFPVMFFISITAILVIMSQTTSGSTISLGLFPSPSAEISVTQRASYEIATNVLKESPKNIVLGSGPTTFTYGFSKYRPSEIAQTLFWNARFQTGASDFSDRLMETGLLGALAFLILLVMFIIRAAIILSQKTDNLFVLLGVFAAWSVVTVSLFIYPATFTIWMLFWLLTACFFGMTRKQEEKDETVLNQSSVGIIIISFVFVTVFIFGIFLLFWIGQRVAAEVQYYKGLEAFQNRDFNQSLEKITDSIRRTGIAQDNYLRDASLIYLFTAQDELSKLSTEDTEKAYSLVSPLINSAIESSRRATELSPSNVINWANHAYLYRQLANFVSGSEDFAIQYYEKAVELEWSNPYFHSELGQLYLYKKDLPKAKEKFQTALDLNPNYANALYFLGLIYDQEGNKQEAEALFTRLAILNPDNEEVKIILQNLREGKPTLEGIISPEPTAVQEQIETLTGGEGQEGEGNQVQEFQNEGEEQEIESLNSEEQQIESSEPNEEQ